MLATILSWLGGKVIGPVACACALLLAGLLAWQTARIDGLPLVGGGLKAQVTGLQQQIAARDLAAAQAQAAALAARAQLAAAQETIARAAATRDQAIQTQIQTVIREVPVDVDAKDDAACVVPWGLVRLLDAAASGADLRDVAARVAPGFADDAASDVKLSEIATVLAGNLGAARQNAGQLGALEKTVSKATNLMSTMSNGKPDW